MDVCRGERRTVAQHQQNVRLVPPNDRRLTSRRSAMAISEVGALPAAPRIMVHALAANWWLIFLRGLCAVLFGVLAFIWPGVTLVTLVLLYGAYALADGVLALIAAVKGGAPAPRWWLALVGLA